MTEFNDYRDDMTVTQLGDREVEQLLSGSTGSSNGFKSLEAFIAVLSKESEPPRDPAHMATALAASARASGRSGSVGRLRRLAVVAVSAALALAALSGVALAANGSAPGDALYGLDQALERLGIGAGGVDERIAEFDVLIAAGDEAEAVAFLAEYIQQAGDDASKAQLHLELAITTLSPNAAAAQERVAEVRAFIEANRGAGVGVDGNDFGQGVADIVSSNPDNGQPENPGGGQGQQPENPGGGQGQQPEDPGQQPPPADDPVDEEEEQPAEEPEDPPEEDESTQPTPPSNPGQGSGNSGNTGGGQGQGNSGNAGGGQGQGNSSNAGSSNNQQAPSETPSATAPGKGKSGGDS